MHSAWVAEGIVDYLATVNDVRPFIAASAAVVLPSHREGLPRSLLEAAAMCRPLIAADVPDSRQVVDHEVNGYLWAVRDAGSLASAMARLAGLTPDQRDASGQPARKKVQEQFNEQYVVQASLDVIAGLSPDYAVA